MKLSIILGDQLFPVQTAQKSLHKNIFMAEAIDLAARYKFHKQKIYYCFSSMRHYSEELKDKKFKVHYQKFDPKKNSKYFEYLRIFVKKNKVSEISLFEPADLFVTKALAKFCKNEGIQVEMIKSHVYPR